MKKNLEEDRPIYLQIKEQIEELIIDGSLVPNERVPSTNEFAKYYQINPATAAKGINELVMEEILYKRRGVGMFVAEGARTLLREKRKALFFKHYVQPLQREAKRLGIDEVELSKMIQSEEDSYEN